MAVVWGVAGGVIGTVHALWLYLRSPAVLDLGLPRLLLVLVGGDAIAMAIAGAGFGVALGLWGRHAARRRSGRSWVAWGVIGAVGVTAAMAVWRLTGLHLPASTLLGAIITVSATAGVAALGTVAAAELSARREGHSLLRRGQST
jgi:peptidoglycan biosynthesis protein MviN/MurJ (putative lipid II flippase)